MQILSIHMQLNQSKNVKFVLLIYIKKHFNNFEWDIYESLKQTKQQLTPYAEVLFKMIIFLFVYKIPLKREIKFVKLWQYLYLMNANKFY